MFTSRSGTQTNKQTEQFDHPLPSFSFKWSRGRVRTHIQPRHVQGAQNSPSVSRPSVSAPPLVFPLHSSPALWFACFVPDSHAAFHALPHEASSAKTVFHGALVCVSEAANVNKCVFCFQRGAFHHLALKGMKRAHAFSAAYTHRHPHKYAEYTSHDTHTHSGKHTSCPWAVVTGRKITES